MLRGIITSEVRYLKLDKLYTVLCGFVLAFALSFACAACIASAFAPDVIVNFSALALWCAFFSLLSALCFSFRLSIPYVAFMLLLAYLLCRYSDLILSFQALLHNLTTQYDIGYGWGVLTWEIEDLALADQTKALQAVASVICASVSWTVCQRRATFWAIAGALLPFLSCTFLLKTVPDEKYLMLWLLALLVLVLSQPTRRSKERDGNKLTALLLIPTSIAVLILFAFMPQESYSGRKQADAALEKIETYFGIDEKVKVSAVFEAENVDLTEVGRQSLPYIPVMEIYAPRSEGYYLRGRAYDIYDGMSWSDSKESCLLPWRQYETEREELKIRTRNTEPYLYQPYRLYAQQMQSAGNAIENKDGVKEYTYSVYDEGSYSVNTDVPFSLAEDYRRLTALPVDTRQWAEDFWQETLFFEETEPAMMDEIYLIYCIRNFIDETKEYSLNTSKMPSELKDFARWFMEDSGTGYCVHFATASTVLLRAMGVPARYVTGYYVEAEAGRETTVFEKNSHAWVEYWSEIDGWTIFDPTPSAEESQTPTYTTEQTVPDIATTEPTEPTTQAPTQPKPTNEPETQENTSDKPTQQVPVKNDESVFPEILKWILVVLGSVFIIILQSRLRLKIRTAYTNRGGSNARALKLWKRLQKYRKSGLEPPLQIALRAKFSAHEISDGELREMEAYIKDSVQLLKKRAWYHRIIDRIILALY